ncbi:MAG TPA: amidase [Burkholderiales bacterium]|jgi:amidase|nr:amidase [Burkholderiales bacterium]
MNASIPFLPATRLAALIRRKKIGCVELLERYLERVARLNPKINAIVVLDEKRARERARKADRAAARNDWWGPLHGVPMTVKESFDVEGLVTCWGRPDMTGNVAKRHALAVHRLLGAGAVIFGKTNVPLMLADWQSFNPVYGTTSNPWDPARTPGGSSGGAAAALAAGLTGLELGSDIAASIRNPAHYCGVFGHKPTFELCPIRGHNLPPNLATRDMMVIGPLARSAQDLEIALRILAQPDELEARGIRVALAKPKAAIRQLRIALLTNAATAEVDDSVQAQVAAAADCFARAGAKVSERARPDIDLEEAHRVFIYLLRSATCAALTEEQFDRHKTLAATLAPDDDSYPAWMARANTMTHREWHHWNEKRALLRQKWAEFFREWDLLLCPAAASAAFPHNQKGERWERMITVNGKPQPSTTQMFWAGYSGLAYLPSTVAPAGFTADGLPVGVQIVGPQYADLSCIAAAKFLEREHQGFVAPPPFE